MKKFFILSIVSCLMVLTACAPKTIKAPCNDYGQNCDPKIKINQWTP